LRPSGRNCRLSPNSAPKNRSTYTSIPFENPSLATLA
jgi:hypothetical protein